MTTRFTDASDAATQLRAVGYLADDATATTTFVAQALGKPLLVEGPAGVGKTALATSLAAASDARLIRLQCYEGLDEAKALYEWNYRKQLLAIQHAAADDAAAGWDAVRDDVFGRDYLIARPLLDALTHDGPVVLLIDEVDKVDFEFEALLLELLGDFQVTVPELGTITAVQTPTVVLTSNATRELSEALKRRCLFLHLDYPDAARERAIVAARVPDVADALARDVVAVVRSLRQLELRKSPSVSETLDWVRALLALGVDGVDDDRAVATLNVLVKHDSDLAKARAHLRGQALGAVATEPR